MRLLKKKMSKQKQLIEIGEILSENKKIKTALSQLKSNDNVNNDSGCENVNSDICSTPIECAKRWSKKDKLKHQLVLKIGDDSYNVLFENNFIIDHLINLFEKIDVSILDNIKIKND